MVIQFGHNDQSARPERWTDLDREFPANLTLYIAEVRADGGIPVLVTPLVRRVFNDGKRANTLTSWAAQIRRVAEETRTPLFDFNSAGADLIQRVGAVEAMTFAMTNPHPAELA